MVKRIMQPTLTSFFSKSKVVKLSKKVLLKTSGVQGLSAEMGADERITFFVKNNGLQKLVAIVNGEQFKAIMGIPPLELSLIKLREILPDLQLEQVLSLFEGMMMNYRGKLEDEGAEGKFKWMERQGEFV
jgi:hypothetical protein